MKFYPGILIFISAISLLTLFTSWGYQGHKKVNEPVALVLPSQMDFLKSSWTVFLPEHGSDADYRKDSDPTESPKHYIDIDNYPTFVENGKIPMSWDSVLTIYGSGFVISNGTLPWATCIAFDSVKACFERRNFDRAAIFAADLGHYVADGHMPLHITRNYNGQYTGQTGVHSRYESKMINAYVGQISYKNTEAVYVEDVTGFIFSYLYQNYSFVDSVLYGDQQAYTETGSHTSSAYLASYWGSSNNYTTILFKNATQKIADLIYTAWVTAGSPYPTGIAGEPVLSSIRDIYPNPCSYRVIIPVESVRSDLVVTIKIMNEEGKVVQKLNDSVLKTGRHDITWDCSQEQPGLYFAVLVSGEMISVRKFIVAN